MPQLTRLRLCCIGNELARIDDLTVPFYDAEGNATNTTIWLRNGGGKTVIISLLFWLICPNKKMPDDRRHIEDYVQPQDRSVIVAEWQLDNGNRSQSTGEPERYLTGVFCERQPGNEKLRRLYFVTKVIANEPRLNLEGLPLYAVMQGKKERRTLSGFKQEWQALGNTYSHAGINETESPGDWRILLEQARIDPELFAYQIKMNSREGGAEDIFKYRDADRFVDFFLELMTNGKLGNATVQTKEQHRIALQRQREQLQPEHGLLCSIIEHLEPLRGAIGERRQMHQRVQQARHELNELDLYAVQRKTELQRDKEMVEQQREEARNEMKRLQLEAEQGRRRAAILHYASAQKQVQRLKTERDLLQQSIEVAKIDQILWYAAAPLQVALRKERSIAEHREQLATKQKEHEPLITALQQSAYAYVSAIRAKIEKLGVEQYDWAQAKQQAIQQANTARNEATQKNAEAIKLDAKVQMIVDRLDTLRRTRTELETKGILLPGECYFHAQDRLAQLHTHVQEDLRTIGQKAQDLEQKRRDNQESCSNRKEEKTHAINDASHAREQLDTIQKKRRGIESDSHLQRYLELEEIDAERLDHAAIGQLQQAEHGIDGRILQLQVETVEHKAIIRYLDEQHLLPPTRDVERVLELLKKENILGWSGWNYIAVNIRKAEVRTFLQYIPELAFGIIVRDAHYQRAQEVLQNSRLHLDSLVVVAPQETMQRDRQAQMFVVGPTSDAYFDRDAADFELADRTSRCSQTDQDQKKWKSERGALRTSTEQLKQFLQDYPLHVRRDWQDALDKAIEQQCTLQTRLDALQREQEQIDGQNKQNTQRQNELSAHLQSIQGQQAKLEANVTPLTMNVTEIEHDFYRFQADADDLREAAERLLNQAKEFEEQREEASEKGTHIATYISVFKERISTVKHAEEKRTEDVFLSLQTDDIETLRDRYEQLLIEYDQKIGPDAFNAIIQTLQKDAREERQKFNRRLKAPVDEARVRAELDALIAPTPEQIDQYYTEAIIAETNAHKDLQTKENERTKAATVLREAKQKCTELGLADGDRDKDIPTDEAECAHEASAQEMQVETLAEAVRECETAVQVALEQLRKLDLSLQKLEGMQEQIQTMREGYKSLFSAAAVMILPIEFTFTPPVDEAFERALQELRKFLNDESERTQTLDHQRSQVTQNTRKSLSQVSVAYPKVTISRRLQEYSEEDYERDCSPIIEKLSNRKQEIEEELAQTHVHRDLIVKRILELAENGIKLLKSLARRSKLPISLPAFGQQPFIKITLADALSPDEQRIKIGGLLESILEEGKMLEGLELQQRAVRRLAGSIKVHLLFPDAHAPHYVPITELAKESGGERLTSIILLYCTLIQLRAIERTQYTDASSSLILDNPLGAASRPAFLELQREVAQAMNIQLIYTTGIRDIEAIRMISNVVRLRNDYFDAKSGEHLLTFAEAYQGLQAMRVIQPEAPKTSKYENEQKQ